MARTRENSAYPYSAMPDPDRATPAKLRQFEEAILLFTQQRNSEGCPLDKQQHLDRLIDHYSKKINEMKLELSVIEIGKSLGESFISVAGKFYSIFAQKPQGEHDIDIRESKTPHV